MRRTHFFMLGTAAFLMLATTPMVVGQAPAAARPPVKPLVDADNKRMQPEQGLVSTTVFGDPNKPGMYVIRNRFAPGVTSRPHFHDQDRFVTVIKGTWYVALGPDSDTYAPEKMTAMKAGSFVFHPAFGHHYDMAKDEEAVVRIIGMGPVKTINLEQPKK